MQRSIKKFELLHFCATQKTDLYLSSDKVRTEGSARFSEHQYTSSTSSLSFPSANLAVEASLSLLQLVDQIRLRLAIVDSGVKFIFCHFHRLFSFESPGSDQQTFFFVMSSLKIGLAIIPKPQYEVQPAA